MSDKLNYPKNPSNPAPKVDLAYVDDLTSLYNRRYLYSTLANEISKVKEKHKKLSLFMIDFDGFKQINDTYGHLAGDKVLVGIAAILKDEIGRDGIPIRYAGDEFTIILPGMGADQSLRVAHQLLQSVARYKVELKSGKKLLTITVSIGVAVYPDDADGTENLLDKADQALYSSKRTGKNKISTVKDLVSEVQDRDLVLHALPCKIFINREKEMEFLKKSYNSMKDGEKKLVLIKGNHGVGKTRLMLELFNFTEKCPRLLLKCRLETLEQQYGAISIALNTFLNYIDEEEILIALDSLSSIDRYALISTVDKVKNLLAGRDNAISKKELHDENMFSAFTNFLRGLNLKDKVVLIDDILWIDKGSMNIIRWILQDPGLNGALVVATLSEDILKAQKVQRIPFTDFMDDEKVKSILEIVNLNPFSERDVSQFLKGVFSGLPLPSDIGKKITHLSHGYPSNIEEIIKHFLNAKIVYPNKGKWSLNSESLDKIPSSINDILNMHISGLDDESREILSKAAILGSDFNIDILKHLYGKNEGQLLDTLDKLKDEGILQRSMLPAENILSFANNVTRESVYNAIKKEESRDLHKNIAELLERYHRLDLDKYYGQLKYHLKEAGEIDRLKSYAARYSLQPFIKAGVTGEEIEPSIEPSIEEAIEVPLSEKSLKIGPDVVYSIRAAWVNSQLYPRDNKTRIESIENLHQNLKKIFDNDLSLTVTAAGDNILLNGQPLSRKKLNVILSQAFNSLFADYGISSIFFKRGLEKKELDSLFLILSKEEEDISQMGGLADLLKENNITHIKINEIRYRKESELAIRTKKAMELFQSLASGNPEIGNLFSAGDKGLVMKKEVLADSKNAFGSITDAITAMSHLDTGADERSLMILEGLRKSVDEVAKGGITETKGAGKTHLGKLLLSLEPVLREKIIENSAYYGTGRDNFVIDALTEFDQEDIGNILNDGRLTADSSPEKFNKFLKIIIRSQELKKASREEISHLLKKAKIDKDVAAKALEDVFAISNKSFFNDMAKEIIEKLGKEVLKKKSIDNLKPLTEALLLEGDIKTIKKIVDDLESRITSGSPQLRAAAAKGLGNILDVLLEKEVFNVSDTIGTELCKHIKAEKNVNTYVEFLKDLEGMVNTLIQKQNFSSLLKPLSTLNEEINQRATDFKGCLEETVDRITNPQNMDRLMLSFSKRVERDYMAVIDSMSLFEDKILDSLIVLLCREDDTKLDPFVIYMKKRNIALIMKKIGEKAALKLKDYINDKRPYVAKNIIEVFRYMDDAKYIPYLEQALKHSNNEIRKLAAGTLEKLKRKNKGD